MNDKTGEVRDMTPDEAARLNHQHDLMYPKYEEPTFKGGTGKWVPLTDEEARTVAPMNREQRRRWLREARRNGAKRT